MLKKTTLLGLTMALCLHSLADEGMWLPHLLQQLNEPAMRNLGMKISAEQIYSINNNSMKDAVVLFGGGCTGELISQEGLLLTNHHCGYGSIQRHSSVQHDYLTDGFWSKKKGEELLNPGLTATFIIRIETVTDKVLAGMNPSLTDAQKQQLIVKNSKQLEEDAVVNTHYKAEVVPMFYGTEYYLFVSETFSDVRLVGAPPSSIGKFGGETDNWVWPRHTGDFSLFRIYAGPDNKPAAPSPSNVPYRPRYWFPISLQGVKPGDFTLVYGFPGRTQEYLTSFALKLITEKVNAPKIKLRKQRMDIMHRYMKQDPAVRIQYAAKYASLANYWKKWMGENKGLQRYGAIARKEALQTQFQQYISHDPALRAQYGNLLVDIEDGYNQIEKVLLAVDYQREAVLAVEAFYNLGFLDAMATALKDPKADKAAIEKQTQERQRGLFKNFYRPIDREQFALCMMRYASDVPPDAWPQALKDAAATVATKHGGNWQAWGLATYDASLMGDTLKSQQLRKDLLKGKPAKLQKDPLYALYTGFRDHYTAVLLPTYRKHSASIERLNAQWLAAQREMKNTTPFYPDANSTLRVAYGQVQGYQPADGAYYHYRTTLDGVIQKEDPENEEFVVPTKLKQLYEAKDYGPYAQNDTLPVAFVATNHTTGGNSGSPVLDANGYLIGTNFDRCWEGTMSDIMYDPDRCRNITLDIRYTLFIIDKFAGASHLVDEMTIVRN